MAKLQLPKVNLPKLHLTRKDYWKIGPVYVWKWIILTILAALAGLALTVFGLPSFVFPKQDIPTYRFDDARLAKLSGTVRVLDSAGVTRYEGEVDGGVYSGHGRVYDAVGQLVYDGPLTDGAYEGAGAKVYQDGRLVYEGDMAGNNFEGQGRRFGLDSGIISEGLFSRGRLNGEGQEYYVSGGLLRSGVFSNDLLNGKGQEYNKTGALLREGDFVDGLLHGDGVEYTQTGVLQYEGQFQHGVYHGQGRLYDPHQKVLVYEGEFANGRAIGQGRIFHASGQLLYEGVVYDGRPRADAFLGLSLAEVETAFQEHWQLYSCGDVTAFIYPYFQMMFITESPIKLISPAQENELTEQQRQELLEAIEKQAQYFAEQAQNAAEQPEAYSAPFRWPDVQIPESSGPPDYIAPVTPSALPSASPSSEPAAEDMILSPETEKKDLTISEVLSYGQELPGVAQPQGSDPSGSREVGWREWFSGYASGQTPKDVVIVKSGPFIYTFSERPLIDRGTVEYFLASGGGVQTFTVWKDDKETPFWYQSAVREAVS